MSRKRILIVEDETEIIELHKYNLEKEGYEVFAARSGEEAMELVNRVGADLLVLDLMLPGINGLDVCRRIRRDSRLQDMGIIMVTAKNEDSDIVMGLEIGADDYVTKPFSPKVLTARIRNFFRRKETGPENPSGMIIISGIKIDPERFEVFVQDNLVKLSATEFAILSLLAKNPGIVHSRSRIINSIKGDDYPVTERSVDVQILGLRKKLGSQGEYIETVRGIGYRFRDGQI